MPKRLRLPPEHDQKEKLLKVEVERNKYQFLGAARAANSEIHFGANDSKQNSCSCGKDGGQDGWSRFRQSNPHKC